MPRKSPIPGTILATLAAEPSRKFSLAELHAHVVASSGAVNAWSVSQQARKLFEDGKISRDYVYEDVLTRAGVVQPVGRWHYFAQ